ncbi:MAG: putative two-component histidine kinase [Ilumatobacteraceae bacterium]|nr:putative two-component histidine kinase [Ilumatobacteraceae bacterium]
MTDARDPGLVEPDERASVWQRAYRAVVRFRVQRLGLRTRILLTFSLGFLALSIFLAAITFSFTKSTLIKQREKASVEQTYHDASVALNELNSAPAGGQGVINTLTSYGIARPLLNYRDSWIGSAAGFGDDVVPAALKTKVINGQTPARMVITVDGNKVLVVGVPLPEVDASYFEFFSLTEINDTLRSVALSLLFAGFITTLFGVVLGSVASRRAVRPLGDAAQAAKAIAGGRLDTRLETSDDHDLRLLANSFNDMASALQLRVERDARFASDVSHELRSPLMTLAASVQVMQARRDEMPERAQAALDLLVADVSRFQGLVEDLLEISRFDAGAIRLHLEDLLVAEFVRQAIGVSSLPGTPIEVSERAEGLIMQVDRRRLARVIANLIDNARLHGGGEPEVTVTEAENEGEPLGHVWIAVEDHGAGVPQDERHLIFERFARGAVAGRRSSSDGAGLGLALVDEHVRLHGGNVRVEDRRDGEPGARFVIELPAEEVGV